MSKNTFEIKGVDSLQRKLLEAGPKARAASRRGMTKAGTYAVKVLRWTAPQKPSHPKSTGATKMAVDKGALTNKTYTEDSLWIGIKKDARFTVHKYKRESKGEFGKRVKKNQDVGGMTVKKPSEYAYAVEKMPGQAWFYKTINAVRGQLNHRIIKEIYNEVDKLKEGN